MGLGTVVEESLVAQVILFVRKVQLGREGKPVSTLCTNVAVTTSFPHRGQLPLAPAL